MTDYMMDVHRVAAVVILCILMLGAFLSLIDGIYVYPHSPSIGIRDIGLASLVLYAGSVAVSCLIKQV